jgi:hypothetical protein
MKRAVTVLVAGLVAAVAAYCALYFFRTSCDCPSLNGPAPELQWLKDEFRLGDPEFQRVVRLHEDYKPRCEEMCHRIAGKRAELKHLIDHGETNATVLEQKLTEAAALRLQCQTNMLRHFLSVAAQMPPEQGRRYLAWIQERTFVESGGMMEAHH